MVKLNLTAEGGSSSGGSGKRKSSSSELLPNKSKTQNESASNPPPIKPSVASTPTNTARQRATLSLPQAQTGIPVPYIAGTVRISSPNVIWYGNEQSSDVSIPILGPNGQPTVTTSYKDLVDIQFSLCTGPGVKLRGLYSGSDLLWSGNIGPDRTEFTPGATEGVYAGTAIFYGGEYDQEPEPLIVTALAPEDVPGYVGIAHLILVQADRAGDYAGFSFEVERIPNPLSLTDGVNKSTNGKDVNLMSLLVDVLTSDWNASGLSIAKFHQPTLASVAAVLAGEGNFGSIAISDDSLTADEVVKMIEAQADGVCYVDPTDGLIKFTLFRPDSVDLEDPEIPLFNESNILRKPDWNKGTWDAASNQVRVLFTDRDADYETKPVVAQTIEVASSGGRTKNSRNVSFPMVCDRDLAATLAAKELALSSGPVYYMKLEVDRTGADLVPGSVIKVSWSGYNMVELPLYVLRRIDYPKANNRVLLECAQFSYPANNVLFPAPEDPGFDPTQSTPLAPAEVKILDMPFILAAQNLQAMTDLTPNDDVSFPLMLARPVNQPQANFWAKFNDDYDASTPKLELLPNGGEYAVIGELASAIGWFDNMSDGIIPSVVVNNVLRSSFAPAFSQFIGDDWNVSQGYVQVYIDDEILAYESWSLVGTTLTLTNVHRGLIDTVPQPHSAGARVWMTYHPDVFNYHRQFRGITKAFDADAAWSPVPTFFDFKGKSYRYPTLSALSANTLSSDGVWYPGTRFNRPLRPHDTRIEGVRSATPVEVAGGDVVTVTFRVRSRWDRTFVINGGTGLPMFPTVAGYNGPAFPRTQLDASQRKEYDADSDKYVQYRVMVMDAVGNVSNCGNSPDDEVLSASIEATIPIDSIGGPALLWVEAYNDYSDSSRFKDVLPMYITSNLPLGTEDELYIFITEDGNSVFIEE